MSRVKNLSRAGWVMVGLVLAMLLVPSVAIAATLTYNGIEGTNGTTSTLNKGLVTSAGQLLTTEVQPAKYVDYSLNVNTSDGTFGGLHCYAVATVPAGRALVVSQVEEAALQVDADTTYSGPNGSTTSSLFVVYADTSTDAGVCNDSRIVTAVTQAGTVGTISVPVVPGYVLPSGYSLDVLSQGTQGYIYFTGYLVPSADAPPTPTVAKQGRIH